MLRFAIISICLLNILIQGCKKKQDGSTEEGNPAAATATIGTPDQDDLDFIVDGEAKRQEDEAVDEVNPLSQCGFADVNDASTPFFEQNMGYTFRRTFEGGLARIFIDARSTIRLGSSQEESFFEFDLNVIDTSGNDLTTGEPLADTSIVTSGAQESMKTFRGSVTSSAFPLRSNFDPAWDGILCTLPGADSLTTTLGGFQTEVVFDPGYPASISPAADPERYAEEIGSHRVFPNIKATVQSTTNPDLEEGKTYTGSVIVEKVDPEAHLPDGSTISSDLAYRITYRFGTEAETRGLGMLIWTETYIDHESREFVLMKANMGSQSAINYFQPVTTE
jgi:hypothetical protein